MRAVREGQVPLGVGPADIEVIGRREHAMVAVGARKHEQDPLAARDHGATNRDVLDSRAQRAGYRTIITQQFVDCILGEAGIPAQATALSRVAPEREPPNPENLQSSMSRTRDPSL